MKPPTYNILTAFLASMIAASAGCNRDPQMAQTFKRKINPPSWDQRVAMATDSTDADNRRIGVTLMAEKVKADDTASLKLFAFILANDTDPFVRAAAATALGNVANPDFAPDIIAALDDRSEIVRWDAAKALGNVPVDGALDPLIARATSDSSTNVRVSATRSLGNFHRPLAVRTLLRLMDAPDLAIRREAHDAMVKIFRIDLGDRPDMWASAAAGEIPPPPTQAQLDAKKPWWQRWQDKRQEQPKRDQQLTVDSTPPEDQRQPHQPYADQQDTWDLLPEPEKYLTPGDSLTDNEPVAQTIPATLTEGHEQTNTPGEAGDDGYKLPDLPEEFRSGLSD